MKVRQRRSFKVTDSRTLKDIKDINADYPFGDKPFGNLLIKKFHHKNETGKSYFLCKCVKCGVDIMKPLRFDTIKAYGKSDQCNCKKEWREHKDMTAPENTLVGQVFGDLTVIDYAGRGKSYDNIWTCKCKCGSISNIRQSNLLNKKKPVRMCNKCAYKVRAMKNSMHYEKLDIKPGDVFGRMVVEAPAHIDRNDLYNSSWMCRCSMCGYLGEYKYRYLLSAYRDPEKRLCHVCSHTEDLLGKKFGRLTPVKFAGFGSNHISYWICKCDCGNYVTVMSKSLKSGNTPSCGCITIENNKKRAIHGDSDTPLYRAYWHMIDRCYNPNNEYYMNYGGRGIRVCNNWAQPAPYGYLNFKRDMGPTYRPGLSIDRINVNGHYCKENCRWITMAEQQRNRRDNRSIQYNGEFYWCTQDFLDKYQFPKEDIRSTSSTFLNRIDNGWSIKEALTIPRLDPYYKNKAGWYKAHGFNGEQDLPNQPIQQLVTFDSNNS